MTIHHIDRPDETIKKIVNASYPSYRGRKFKLSTDIPTKLNSYWGGGSKDDYVFYELSTGKVYQVEDNHPFFTPNKARDLDSLPKGIVIVKHSIFCGKDSGITIFANQEDLVPLLPEKPNITEDERVVLTYTKSLKSSYAGIKNYRFYEANREVGIAEENWNKAKENLISKKLLNKAGAITAVGRNAL